MKSSVLNLSKIDLNRLDSEYYEQRFLKNDISLSKLKCIGLNKLFKILSGNAFPSKAFNVNKGIKIAKITDITQNTDIDSWGFVDTEVFEHYQKNIISDSDILICGTHHNPWDLGKVKQVYFCDDVRTINQRVFLLKIKENDKMLSNYCFIFFNTIYARNQFERYGRGNNQLNLSISELSKIKIPLFMDKKVVNEVSNIVDKYHHSIKQSKDLYNQASKLLEQELGLDKIEFEKKKSFTANFSEIVENNRCDSDYYKNEYRQIEQHIKDFKTISLNSLCFMNKGIEVGSNAYTDEGKLFIRVSNLDINGFKFSNSDKYISQNYYDSLKAYEPQENDILLTKDGTVGTCYVVDEKIEGIISGAIVKLSLKTQDIEPEYFALAVNSKFCQMQISRECSGALIQHWKPEQIRKLQIPIIDYEKMREISKLVIEAKKAKKQSKLLLAQAKKRVEELIEENAL